MTKVMRFTGTKDAAALDAELVGHGPVRVREQRVVEVVLVGELLLLLDGVGADAHPLRPGRLELGLQVPEMAALLGAAVGHGAGVEEEHDRTVGEQLAQPAGGPRLVGSSKSGTTSPLLHGTNVRARRGVALRPRSGIRPPAR